MNKKKERQPPLTSVAQGPRPLEGESRATDLVGAGDREDRVKPSGNPSVPQRVNSVALDCSQGRLTSIAYMEMSQGGRRVTLTPSSPSTTKA